MTEGSTRVLQVLVRPELESQEWKSKERGLRGRYGKQCERLWGHEEQRQRGCRSRTRVESMKTRVGKGRHGGERHSYRSIYGVAGNGSKKKCHVWNHLLRQGRGEIPRQTWGSEKEDSQEGT